MVCGVHIGIAISLPGHHIEFLFIYFLMASKTNTCWQMNYSFFSLAWLVSREFCDSRQMNMPQSLPVTNAVRLPTRRWSSSFSGFSSPWTSGYQAASRLIASIYYRLNVLMVAFYRTWGHWRKGAGEISVLFKIQLNVNASGCFQLFFKKKKRLNVAILIKCVLIQWLHLLDDNKMTSSLWKVSVAKICSDVPSFVH